MEQLTVPDWQRETVERDSVTLHGGECRNIIICWRQ